MEWQSAGSSIFARLGRLLAVVYPTDYSPIHLILCCAEKVLLRLDFQNEQTAKDYAENWLVKRRAG